MKRVAIIGSPGTGKSTFAKQLATLHATLPLIHLDYYYHDRRFNYYADKLKWRERADTIFYFDMPTYLAVSGVIRR